MNQGPQADQSVSKSIPAGTSAASGTTTSITNPYSDPFLIEEIIVRENGDALDANTAFSVGITGTPKKYYGIFTIFPADLSGGKTITATNMKSGDPIAPGGEILITAGGPAVVGDLSYTIKGTLLK